MGSTLTSQNCVDVPLAGNMIGSSVAELVVFRRAAVGRFLIRRASGDHEEGEVRHRNR